MHTHACGCHRGHTIPGPMSSGVLLSSRHPGPAAGLCRSLGLGQVLPPEQELQPARSRSPEASTCATPGLSRQPQLRSVPLLAHAGDFASKMQSLLGGLGSLNAVHKLRHPGSSGSLREGAGVGRCGPCEAVAEAPAGLREDRSPYPHLPPLRLWGCVCAPTLLPGSMWIRCLWRTSGCSWGHHHLRWAQPLGSVGAWREQYPLSSCCQVRSANNRHQGTGTAALCGRLGLRGCGLWSVV